MNFTIDYEIFDKKGHSIKKGTIKVKNKLNELDAKCKLEVYLKRKYPSMETLIISSCKEDLDIYNAFGGIFGDIFK